MGIGLPELIVLFSLLGFVLFIFAFVDIVRSEFGGNDKLIWLISVIFLPIVGSVLYFLVRRKRKLPDM